MLNIGKNDTSELERAFADVGVGAVGQADMRLYKQMRQYYSEVSDMLAGFASILQPSSFDDLKSIRLQRTREG